MIKTEFVTDHEKKVVRAKRGVLGYAKVFAAWFLLAGLLSLPSDPLAAASAEDCLRKGIKTEQQCLAQYSIADMGLGLLAYIVAAALVARKLDRDSKRRYEELRE